MTALVPVILALLFNSAGSETFPSKDTVASWASNLDQAFRELTSGEADLTLASIFKENYKNSMNGNFQVRSPDGGKIVKQMAAEIYEIFDKNTEAAKHLQEAAEDAVREYEYDHRLMLHQVNYINMNDNDNSDEEEEGDVEDGEEQWDDGEGDGEQWGDFEISEHFGGQQVLYQTSGVQVPIEIYEGWIVDKVRNWKKDNPNQMSKICPTCHSVCDLCSNNLFWRQESRFGINDMSIIGDPEILNGIAWSGVLDRAFKENLDKFPDIYWQSFGSQDGFMRVYPAARWHTEEDMPDLYDVRRRPWYIHGSVTPKDMIILLDTSGSMHGQSFDIMKLAAKTLLNTLGEDDYVNVAKFSSNVSWVTPCLDTLVQANSRNKQLLFDGIDQLVDHHIARYDEALSFAFEQHIKFEEEKEEQDGSDCHKLIMLFSDGGTEFPADVIESFAGNSSVVGPGANVRIFTYAVGPHPLPTVALKQMACQTNGRFTSITAMGAIRTKIQSSYVRVIARPEGLSGRRVTDQSTAFTDALEYARVLSKPLVLSQKKDFLRSNFFSRDYLGLGLITTVTLPVFNMSAQSDNQTLVGVVGVDIPVNLFERATPRAQLGPLGYSLGASQNGLLIFHPALWTDVSYLQDPAHVDLEDVEGETSETKKLREALVQGAEGKVLVRRPRDLEARVPLEGSRVFHHVRVEGSGMSIAVAVDEDWKYVEVPEEMDVTRIRSLDSSIASLAPWDYCEKGPIGGNPNDVLPVVVAGINAGDCKSGQAIHHLAWDVSNVYDTFMAALANSDASAAAVSSRFVSTDGGLNLAWTDSEDEGGSDYWTDPYNASAYRLATSRRRAGFFIQRFFSDEMLTPSTDEEVSVLDDENEDLSRSRPLFFKVKPSAVYLTSPILTSDGDYIAGVSGARLRPEFLQSLLMEAAIKGSSAGQDELTCANKQELACFVLDYTGHVVASNQDLVSVEVGDPLGSADPHLMSELSESVFEAFVDRNYQALCPNDLDCCSSSSSPCLSSTLKVLDLLIYTIYDLTSIVQNVGHVLVSVLSVLLFSSTSDAVSEYGFQIPEGLHRCTTNITTWYVRPDAPRELHQRLRSQCATSGECQRDYHLYLLDAIDAILVVSDPKCAGCWVKPFKVGPEEDLSYRENCLLPKRYRKRPKECFATNSEEKSDCNAGSLLLPLQTLFFVFSLPLIFASLSK